MTGYWVLAIYFGGIFLYGLLLLIYNDRLVSWVHAGGTMRGIVYHIIGPGGAPFDPILFPSFLPPLDETERVEKVPPTTPVEREVQGCYGGARATTASAASTATPPSSAA